MLAKRLRDHKASTDDHDKELQEMIMSITHNSESTGETQPVRVTRPVDNFELFKTPYFRTPKEVYHVYSFYDAREREKQSRLLS